VPTSLSLAYQVKVMLEALKMMAETSNINFVRFQVLIAVGRGMGRSTVRYMFSDVSEKIDAPSSMNSMTSSSERSENFYKSTRRHILQDVLQY
jgi:hypothetical protein